MCDLGQLHAQAVTALQRRDWPRVRDCALRMLSMAPDHAGAHYLAGIASLEQRDLSRALPHLQRATLLNPTQIEFAVRHARALATARLGSAAKAAADLAMALDPKDAVTLDVLGTIYTEAGAHAEAALTFRRATELAPGCATFHFNLATALIAIGEIDAARCEIEVCIEREPLFWRAHLAMAHLRQAPAPQQAMQWQTMLAQHGHDREARLCLNFALAKTYEDLGDYPRAFTHLLQGKATARDTIDYSIAQDQAIFTAMERAFPMPQFCSHGDPSIEPIFVFGMPRSGTTLVERILTSHPDVMAAGELQNFGMAVGRSWNNPVPFWVDPDPEARVRSINWQQLGASYLASTRPGTMRTPRFIDKFPFNFLYAGFIARALPNARMICLRRHPMDTCLGNFRQLFAEKLPYYHYSFDLLDTGRYYVMFDHLIAHWRKVFPDRILELDYEALASDPEPQIRRLLSYCGLQWHDECMHFERNKTPVATASSLQVRMPMQTSSLGRWAKYAPQLVELRELLEHSGIHISPDDSITRQNQLK